jgi:hypothetical protein
VSSYPGGTRNDVVVTALGNIIASTWRRCDEPAISKL